MLIGFDEKAYGQLAKIPRGEVEAKFKELYAKTIRPTMEHTEKKLEEKGIHLESVEFFFFPVPSVDTFRQTFLKKLNA